MSNLIKLPRARASRVLPRPTTKGDLTRGGMPFIVERCWFVTRDGRMLRMLVRTDYNPCVFGGEPRTFYFRLRPDDLRPLGRRLYSGKRFNHTHPGHEQWLRGLARWHGQMEFGIWYWPPDEIRIPDYHDHTAIAVVPTAALALRKERAS